MIYGVYVCWIAHEDDCSHGPQQTFDGSEDDVVSSHIPEIDSEHAEQDDSASDSSSVDVMGGL